jgi:hypothetical protein
MGRDLLTLELKKDHKIKIKYFKIIAHKYKSDLSEIQIQVKSKEDEDQSKFSLNKTLTDAKLEGP